MTNDFVSKNVQDYFIKCENKMKIFIPEYNFTMNLYYHKKMNLNFSKLLTTIKQVIVTTKLFEIDSRLVIHFICCPDKRYFPSHSSSISPKHINGGFTNTSHNEIYITRTEEYPKVIIHEVLHHCEKIHGEFSHQNISMLKSIFNISHETTLIPNEAVVELWATILATSFMSLETNIPFKLLLDAEIKHSICQSKKLLKKQGKAEWVETTNAYCYIVFKTILLLNIDKFFEKYTFPYDDSYITTFLIVHKNCICEKKNWSSLHGKKSLRITTLS